MSHDLARIRARLFNTPLLVLPDVATTIAANLGDRLFSGAPLDPRAFFDDDDDEDFGSQGAAERPYALADGVATIQVRGELVNRGAWLNSRSGLTSYEGLSQILRQAAADPDVKAIALDISSPGGEATGAMEIAALVRQVSKTKPITAVANGLAASAAYAIAAGASKIVLPPTAQVGSIGVVMLHMDRSKMLNDIGLKPTLLHAGAYKIDGNSMQPLKGDARDRLQASIDDFYDLFVKSVGGHRPDLGEDGARKTEAGIFIGQKAVDAGLADEVGDLFSAVDNLRRKSAKRGALPTQALHSAASGSASASQKDKSMAVKLYGPGEAHANSLIDDGKVDRDSAWSFSGEDGDKLLGSGGDDWTNYARFHLGEDGGENEQTKARYKYPFGKDGKVYRSGVIAAKDRAGAEGAKDIEDAAGRLLEKIDKDKEKQAAMDQAAIAAATETGRTEGAAAERARIKSILESDEARGRETSAQHLAFNTDLSLDNAKAVLAGVALPAPAAAAPARGSRMAQVPNPDVRPSAADERPAAQREADASAALWDSVVAKIGG